MSTAGATKPAVAVGWRRAKRTTTAGTVLVEGTDSGLDRAATSLLVGCHLHHYRLLLLLLQCHGTASAGCTATTYYTTTAAPVGLAGQPIEGRRKG